MTAAIVAHDHANVFRHGCEVTDEFADPLVFQLRLAGDGVVQIGDVGLMMLAVVNLHRAGIDVRFEGVIGISEFGQCVWHDE